VLAPVLWIEAERMRGLALSESSLQNQKDVVKNEVRVKILNQPYGGFPWLALPQVANQNWYNAHNFYGDLADIDAATLGDVRTFYDTYYVPSNAVLVVAGDFDTASTKEAIARDFGPLPKRTEPQRPDVSEPTPTMGRVVTQSDPKAPRPALAWGYPVPPRGSSDWYAFVLLDGILLQGEDSRLWRKLVQQRGYADGISGGINLLGSAFDIEGPTLWSAYLIHDQGISADVITKDLESSIREVQETPIGAQELARANTKIRSALYDIVGSNTRFGLVNLLASFALFDDDPTRINRIESEFRAVTPGDLQRVAQRYLTPSVRTQLTLEAGHGSTTVKP
jgi:predicted Zn-dependent peptidase